MQLARVIGRARTTVRHAALDGWKLLLVQPLDAADGADGDPVLSIDPLGCSAGCRVIVTTDGKAIRQLVGRDDCPIRFATVALPD